MNLEQHFAAFRKGIIGNDQCFSSPYGEKRILYADWTASGRLYAPIEDALKNTFGPFVANTHTETSITGTYMTKAYHEALHIIKDHVNANSNDALICYGTGMTGVVNKFQRIIGLKIHERFRDRLQLQEDEKPIVFVTHMEHHSNQTSWLETICDVQVIPPDEKGDVDLNALQQLLAEFHHRPIKIAAITSCSNVTGIFTLYHEIASIMHRNGGLCFVDFACSAPYIKINMHPEDKPDQALDAIFFSPHKFLGGPGTSGVLIFNKSLYKNRVPDNPGGGTVDWTNPWGEHKYVDDIEAREDGGTPGFLQAIRTGLAIKLKEKMGVENILKREKELLEIIWPEIIKIDGLHVLADNHPQRLGVISFYIEGLHYNLGVKLLNDKFGIQVRGGCSCAGTYGHYLLEVSYAKSKSITDKINQGILTDKPGWIRMSIHPTMTDQEAEELVAALRALAANFKEWSTDYIYDPHTNEFKHKDELDIDEKIQKWFELPFEAITV